MNEAEYLIKIMAIEESVIRGGRRPRRMTPSEISIILHMIRKPNSIIVLLFIQNNSQFKNNAKTCLPPSMLSSPSIVHVQGCSAPQIFPKQQMSPFDLCSCCFCHVFSYNFAQLLLLKRVKCPPFFVFTTKTTQPRPQVFSANGALERCIFDVISSLNTKFFQIWSSVTGYGESCVCFQPIRIGEIFRMNNNSAQTALLRITNDIL